MLYLLKVIAVVLVSFGCRPLEQAEFGDKIAILSTRQNLEVPPSLPSHCASFESSFAWKATPIDIEGDGGQLELETSQTILIPKTMTDTEPPMLIDAGACIFQFQEQTFMLDIGEWSFEATGFDPQGVPWSTECTGVVAFANPDVGGIDDDTYVWIGFTVGASGCVFETLQPLGVDGEHPEA